MRLPGTEGLGPVITGPGHTHFPVIFIHDVPAVTLTGKPSAYYFLFGPKTRGNVLPVSHPVIAGPLNAHTAIRAIGCRMAEVFFCRHILAMNQGCLFQLIIPLKRRYGRIIFACTGATRMANLVYQLEQNGFINGNTITGDRISLVVAECKRLVMEKGKE